MDAYFVQSLMPPAIANTIIGNLTQFASKAKRLSAVGAVALIFTSAAMMSLIERVFNQIWRVRQPRPLDAAPAGLLGAADAGADPVRCVAHGSRRSCSTATSGLVRDVPRAGHAGLTRWCRWP